MIQYSPGLVETLATMEAACSAHAELCDLLHEAVSLASSTNPTNCHGRMLMLRAGLTDAVILAESLCPPDMQALPLQ